MSKDFASVQPVVPTLLPDCQTTLAAPLRTLSATLRYCLGPDELPGWDALLEVWMAEHTSIHLCRFHVDHATLAAETRAIIEARGVRASGLLIFDCIPGAPCDYRLEVATWEPYNPANTTPSR